MLGAPAAACIVTLAATPIVTVCMHRLAAIDEVTARSSHQAPTPRGGGIAVVLGLFAGVVVTVLTRGGADSPDLLPLTAAAALFGLIGLAEDIGGVTAKRRLALHTATSFVIAAMAVLGALLGDPAPGLLIVLLVTVAAPLWITGFVNVFNFMDGINGISAVTAALAGGACTTLGATHDLPTLTVGGMLVAASALGFLPFNFPHARIFLGDVGSYALGAVLAVLAVQAVLAGIPPEPALAPTALYLADTSTTLARRILAGEQWYSPHRSHAYQRLIIAGWSHVRVTGLVAATTALLIALSLAAFGPPAGRFAADAAAGLVLLAYLRAPRWAARRGQPGQPGESGESGESGQPAQLPAQRRPAPTDDSPDRRTAPGSAR